MTVVASIKYPEQIAQTICSFKVFNLIRRSIDSAVAVRKNNIPFVLSIVISKYVKLHETRKLVVLYIYTILIEV